MGVQECHWIRQLLVELGLQNDASPVNLHCDNQSAIFAMRDNANSKRAKHIDIEYLFVRDAVQSGQILVSYCPTGRMPADIFTKSLPAECLAKARETIGVVDYLS
ncbi:hypothetical protein AeRB84_012561 [Aphanomyces euteiches]|nr:hypothetical protein AeRB84_012561 [Aphanomyces euteiches]